MLNRKKNTVKKRKYGVWPLTLKFSPLEYTAPLEWLIDWLIAFSNHILHDISPDNHCGSHRNHTHPQGSACPGSAEWPSPVYVAAWSRSGHKCWPWTTLAMGTMTSHCHPCRPATWKNIQGWSGNNSWYPSRVLLTSPHGPLSHCLEHAYRPESDMSTYCYGTITLEWYNNKSWLTDRLYCLNISTYSFITIARDPFSSKIL